MENWTIPSPSAGVTVSVPLLVTRSPSLPASPFVVSSASTTVGAAGATVSSVIVVAGDVKELPAASVIWTVKS